MAVKRDTDTQVQEAFRLLREKLLAFKRKAGLTADTELCAVLKIPRQTLQNYIHGRSLPAPGQLARLQEVVDTLTADDVKKIGVGYSRKRSLGAARGYKRRRLPAGSRSESDHRLERPEAPPEPTPLASVGDAELGRLLRVLAHAVIGNDGVYLRSVPDNPLALLQSQQRYVVGDMPAVLTGENFESIDVSQWSPADRQHFLAYTNLMLEEARKCMVLLAQIASADDRDDLLARAGRNARLLWQTFRAASAVVPEEVVRDIELARSCEKL